jgi:hypothetical protein
LAIPKAAMSSVTITATEPNPQKLIPSTTMRIPTQMVSTSTPTPSEADLWSFEEFDKIKVTQGPVIIVTKNIPDNTYLYKDVKVAFRFTDSMLNGRRYLNLDDLNDNGAQNSDIIVDVSQGSGGNFFHFYPANYAKYYLSGKDEMDYDSCVKEFPKDNLYTINDIQSFKLGSGKPFCILTNEGHMAVVYYVHDSDLPNDQGIIDFTLVVTVYQEKVLSIFTPAPTYTPGPSPTLKSKFTIYGLSDKQVNELNHNVQAFIDAAAARDQEAIINMAAYPLKVRIGLHEVYLVNNSQDFFALYDRVFTAEFLTAVSRATLENLQGEYFGLYLDDSKGIIYFTKDGKIREVDNYIDI